jgi:hypothetical protein
VINDQPQITISGFDYYGVNYENIRCLVISSQLSASSHLAWLEVPGLRESPIATPHMNLFNPGDRLTAYDGRFRRDATIYQISQEKNEQDTGIVRAKGFPITIHFPIMDGPNLADAHPIFDSAGAWAGFLLKELPQTELCTRPHQGCNSSY